MRPLKMVGLVALTITTIAASVGASTATATRLCSTSTAPCGSIYANNTSFATHAFGGSLVITTSGSPVGVNPTLSCSSTLLQFQNTNQGGGAGVPVAGKVPTWTLSGCTSSNPSTCEPRGTPGSADTATGTIAFLAGASGTLQVRLQSAPVRSSGQLCNAPSPADPAASMPL